MWGDLVARPRCGPYLGRTNTAGSIGAFGVTFSNSITLTSPPANELVPPSLPGTVRDALKAHLQANGIPSVIYYVKPLHLQKAYEAFPRGPGGLPGVVTNLLCSRMHDPLADLRLRGLLHEPHVDDLPVALADHLVEFSDVVAVDAYRKAQVVEHACGATGGLG